MPRPCPTQAADDLFQINLLLIHPTIILVLLCISLVYWPVVKPCLLYTSQQHSISEKGNPTCVKKVAYDGERKEYIQLQAVLPVGEDYWTVQKFDNELVYMGEVWSGCKYRDEVTDWMRTNFDIESCLMAGVYRDNKLGDCTNNGISAHASDLYILAEQKGPFEPEDIRQCVYIEWRNCCGEQYIDCKPAYFPKRWYMAGGNFLYTSDSRFREITKSKYPISIHDRYEGRQGA